MAMGDGFDGGCGAPASRVIPTLSSGQSAAIRADQAFGPGAPGEP